MMKLLPSRNTFSHALFSRISPLDDNKEEKTPEGLKSTDKPRGQRRQRRSNNNNNAKKVQFREEDNQYYCHPLSKTQLGELWYNALSLKAFREEVQTHIVDLHDAAQYDETLHAWQQGLDQAYQIFASPTDNTDSLLPNQPFCLSTLGLERKIVPSLGGVHRQVLYAHVQKVQSSSSRWSKRIQAQKIQKASRNLSLPAQRMAQYLAQLAAEAKEHDASWQ